MAKVGASIVGILTFLLVIYNINLCATNPIEETEKHVNLDIKNQYQNIQNATEPLSIQQQQQQQQQQPTTTIIKAATNADKTTTADGSIPYINRPLLGVNGTGQRKDITDILANGSTTTTTVQIQQPEQTKTDETKKTAGSQFPKKVLTATNASPTLTQTSINTNKSSTEIKSKEESVEETPVEKLIDTIDVPENETLTEIGKHNLTINQKTDHHDYYNSSIYYDKTEADRQWDEIKNISPNWMLSTSHRRAMTVVLSFDFPFYGHSVRNVTVATGGFIYTGDYVHSWLAATQYIAPLMANFDTSISNDSFVKLNDTGSSFTVIWQNVYLQDRQDVGKFTFSTTLHANGDISFTYFSVPVLVTSIHDDKHPVKVGLSDAYIIDKVVYYARRKTIYEYHRVNFANSKISNSTLIYLKALPTCLQYTDCASCLNNETTFTCFWCPILNRCSTGTDRKKQDWLAKGCDKSPISNADHCPAVGQKGNNSHIDTSSSTSNTTTTIINNTNTTNTTTTTIPNSSSNNQNNNNMNHNHDDPFHPFKPYNPTGIEQPISSTVATPLDEAHSELHTAGSGTQMKSMLDSADDHRGDNKSMNVTLGLFVPICLVACVLMWVLYAYRNPHTKSGQLLIQYRPSQWSWRRGEARYTAATIHM